MNIVILTGAGISAESGLKTFRDTGGLWENAKIEDVATPEAFARDPEFVHGFYNARRKQLKDPAVQPNAAHQALAELELLDDVNLTLVTQNVDDLHERGGSQNVIHMHGELRSIRCVKTGRAKTWEEDLTTTHKCDCCVPANPLRPDIVWFGEVPKYMESIQSAIYQADIFVAIGTSGVVYPAAGFVDFAYQTGIETVYINLEDTDNTQFETKLIGKASDCVPKWIAQLKEKHGLE